MPTYDYECQGCGHSFEEFQMMSDKHLRKCPECKKLKLKRLIGAGAGLIFKGSGFYETDYKRKENNKKHNSGAASEEKSSETKTENKSGDSKASDKSESKPAPKKEKEAKK